MANIGLVIIGAQHCHDGCEVMAQDTVLVQAVYVVYSLFDLFVQSCAQFLPIFESLWVETRLEQLEKRPSEGSITGDDIANLCFLLS